MDIYYSRIFGEVQQPESFLELMEFVVHLNQLKGRNVMVWRGQGDINWPVHSGAYRRLINGKREKATEWNLSYYENTLIRRARHKGYGTNEGMEICDLELLAKLQHHGAATRLVDFSKNILVALWFSLDSKPDETGLLLGVHTRVIGGESEGVLDNKEEYKKVMERIDEYDYPMFLESPVVSKRIAAQHGVFLYSGVSEEATGSLMLPKEKGGTLFIAISPQLKKECRKILINHFDIRTETLFPDLDGFAFHANSTGASDSEIFRW